MSDVAYRSHVTVTRHGGPLRTAVLPALQQPVVFGVHGAVAEHYGVDPGEHELDGKVLVVKRIHVTYRLVADLEQRDTIERVLGFHADRCPVARTIGGCVDITTAVDLLPQH